MTRAELLADLAAQPHVVDVGTPEPKDGYNTIYPNWYEVTVLEREGDVCRAQSYAFTVFDEGGAGEDACWINNDPGMPRAAGAAFRKWIRERIANNPDNYMGARVHYVDEENRSCVYSCFSDPGGGAPWTMRSFYVRVSPTGTVLTNQQVTIDPELLKVSVNVK